MYCRFGFSVIAVRSQLLNLRRFWNNDESMEVLIDRLLFKRFRKQFCIHCFCFPSRNHPSALKATIIFFNYHPKGMKKKLFRKDSWFSVFLYLEH